LKDSFIPTTAKMCGRCAAILWFGDLAKLVRLQKSAKTTAAPETREE
jgi:hypothetical protein